MTMQDRFLFRAICNDGKFHYGYLSRLYEDRGEGKKGDFCISNNSFCPYAYLVTRPETIGQCTGIKDKNGNLIYEGDIVKIIDKSSRKEPFIGVVEYTKIASFEANCNGLYMHLHESKTYENISMVEKIFCTSLREIEVIGNIYENPELLEQKNDAD